MSVAESLVGVGGMPERCVFADSAVRQIGSLANRMSNLRQAIEDGSVERAELKTQYTAIRKTDQLKMYLMSVLDDCASCERYPGTRINTTQMELFGCMGSQTMINDVISLKGIEGQNG